MAFPGFVYEGAVGSGTEPSAGSKGSNEHRLSRGTYTKVDSDLTFIDIKQI